MLNPNEHVLLKLRTDILNLRNQRIDEMEQKNRFIMSRNDLKPKGILERDRQDS